MALKKYKICVGVCGPTLLYTNIIKAEDERDAVTKYLSETGMQITEEEIQKYISHTHEVLPTPKRKDDQPIVDSFGNPLSFGKTVAFIRNDKPPVLILGEITKVTNSSILITASDGKETRIPCSKGTFKVDRAAIIKKRKNRKEDGGKVDATGYPVYEGDKIIFEENYYGQKSLREGTVKEIRNTTIIANYFTGSKIEQTVKSLSKIVVL